MKEFYHRWYTQYLSRDFEMLVFGHAGFPVILFPTAKGRYFENKDYGLISSVEQLIEEGKIKIYCPDGIDWQSWYNYEIHPADRVKTHMAYEQTILHDVIDFAIYETELKKVAVAGCGFGGFHAANIAFRNPEKIEYLFSLGGLFDIKRFIYGHYDENCYFNNPIDYLPNLTDNWYLDRIKNINIILGTGELDTAYEENKNLSGILTGKDIPHLLDIKQDIGHNWLGWKQMFPQYLSTIK